MSQDEPRYLSYLVRMWQIKTRRGYQWRASLESPGSGKRHTFPNLELLIGLDFKKYLKDLN
jgi:hypothetical protein